VVADSRCPSCCCTCAQRMYEVLIVRSKRLVLMIGGSVLDVCPLFASKTATFFVVECLTSTVQAVQAVWA
jgi:hypothetical protein